MIWLGWYFRKWDCWHWIILWAFYSICVFRNPSNLHQDPFTLQINTARKSSGDYSGGWLGRGLIKESTFWERTLGLWGWLVIRSEVKWPPRLLLGDKQAFGDVKRPEDVSLRPTSPILPFKFAHSFNAIRLVQQRFSTQLQLTYLLECYSHKRPKGETHWCLTAHI